MFDATTKQGQQLRSLKGEYELGRHKLGNDYDFYNLVEKCLLEIDLTSEADKKWVEAFDIQGRIIKEIKGLAMCLSRFKPADWNKFLDVVIKWGGWEPSTTIFSSTYSTNSDLSENDGKRPEWI